MGARGLPIRFEEVSRVKKPPRKASPDEVREYKSAQKLYNLSQRFVPTLAWLRRALNTAKFTPEKIRQDASRPWPETKIFYGAKRRKVRYEQVQDVSWRTGAAKTPLRLIVVAPTPYRKRNSGKLYYRQPAYLLTTDLRSPVKQLLQIYFDRWQIEVNHREEKDTLGVGQAQLWNVTSAPKQPVLRVLRGGLQRPVTGLVTSLRNRPRRRLKKCRNSRGRLKPAPPILSRGRNLGGHSRRTSFT